MMSFRYVVVSLVAVTVICGEATAETPTSYRWTQFIPVNGQPESVPVDWLVTAEGKLAHSIEIPNPLQADSGYQGGMTSKQYFDHLCASEAGIFVYEVVRGVEGFYFMRPPHRPRQVDLMQRYKLEAPDIERTFQLLLPEPAERAKIFVSPPRNKFTFVEEKYEGGTYIRSFGYHGSKAPMRAEKAHTLLSSYGLIWRGIRRKEDRELSIAGSEWIVIELSSRRVLAVMRNYVQTGRTPNTPDGISWRNAISCPVFAKKYRFATSERIYDFVSKVLVPTGAKNVK